MIPEKKMQSIIARFTTVRHRTLLYANRKKIKSGARFRLGLTKDPCNLLASARMFRILNVYVKWVFIFYYIFALELHFL